MEKGKAHRTQHWEHNVQKGGAGWRNLATPGEGEASVDARSAEIAVSNAEACVLHRVYKSHLKVLGVNCKACTHTQGVHDGTHIHTHKALAYTMAYTFTHPPTQLHSRTGVHNNRILHLCS